MAKQVTIVTAESIAAELVSQFDANKRSETVGAKVAIMIAELFSACDSDLKFESQFGNGKLGKENKVGAIKEAVEAKCAKMTKEKREGVAKLLKVRLSEARKLRRLEGMPAKGETIQAALKRYKPAAQSAPRPEGNESPAKFVIPAELSADALADALSLWLKDQNAAKAKAFAKDVAEFLAPAKAPRSRKPAAQSQAT
jgi:hypothetical protein